jgi:hypothetical protein
MSCKYSFFLVLVSILFFCCSPDKDKMPDVSHIEEQLTVRRFEKDFLANTNPDLELLKADYPFFWEVYFSGIMAEYSETDTFSDADAMELHANPYLRDLLDTCLRVFPDLDFLEKDIRKALRYYMFHTGDKNPKTLVSFISEFGVGACTIGDDTLGIGIDMFLGSDFSAYDPTIFPAFIRAQMRPEYMAPQLMKALAQNILPPFKGDRMIDFMIYNGKVLYLLDLFMPWTDKAIKMEYTEEQMDWVSNNESKIWNHFVSRELLYSTRRQEFQKLIGPSPNAPNMPAEAPGQTANYIGWQIVKAFQKKNPELTLADLIALEDPLKILEGARYRPR